MMSPRPRALTALLCVTSLLSLSAPLRAQDAPPHVVYSDDQRRLNDEAVAAIRAEDYEEAINLLLASLKLQEVNLTYLNLGRAYARAGRCEEAIAAYDAVTTAPSLERPSAEQIAEILVQYRKELPDQCKGTLIVRCQPAEMQLLIDGASPRPCDGAPIALPGGEHNLVGLARGQMTSRAVIVQPLEPTEVHLEITVQDDPKPATSSALRTWGWFAVGTGASLLTATLLIEVAGLGPAVDDYEEAAAEANEARHAELREEIEALQGAGLGLFAAGAALTLGGGVMLLLHYLDDEPAAASDANTNTPLSLWIAPSSAGLLWQITW